MAEIRAFGLEYIKIGLIEQFAIMAALGVTFQDTAELIQEDPTETEIFSEENDDPEVILSQKGKTTLKWTIMDVAPDTLVKVLGGTVTTVDLVDTWEAPSAVANIEKAIEVKTVDGLVIKIARAKINAKLNFKFSKKGLCAVDIIATVLKPSVASALSALTITEPAA